MKEKLVIIGSGGHGKKMLELSEENNFNLIGFLSNQDKGTKINNYKILGYLEEYLNEDIFIDCNYHIAIGNNFIRFEIDNKLKNKKTSKNLISKKSILSKDLKIGMGCSINHGAIIQVSVEIGNSVIIDSGCIIEHDCKIGNYVNIHPGSILCGNVEIMDNSIIGSGSIIREKVKIGKNSLIGAGSLVLNDIPDNVIAYGKPAKIISTNRKFSDKYLK